MQVSPELLSTAFEGIRLFIWIAVLIGGGVFAIYRKIDAVANKLSENFEKKHEENRIRVDAIQQLVIRHDTILSPEWNGHFYGKN